MHSDVRHVALVIVHYRTVADTIECLESVLRLEVPQGVAHSVVVVDNASDDGTWDELLAWRSRQRALWIREYGAAELPVGVTAASTHRLVDTGWEVTMTRAARNNGYAAGANIGIRFAIHQSYITDFWVLNNDVVLDSKSLRHSLQRSEQSPRKIYGSSLLYQDDSSKLQAAGGAVYLPALGRSRHVAKRQELTKCERQSYDFDYIVGAALFFSREVLEEIGLLPEQFGLYFEETEYCFRAKARGIDLEWIPEARLVHKEGRSTGASGGFSRLSDLSFRYVVRNSMMYTEMRHPMWLSTVLLYNVFDCVRHCLRGDFGKVRVLGQALKEYWERRPLLAREASASGD
jgi:hypothetical protein